jgi:uncharacterized protein (DUF302 family)
MTPHPKRAPLLLALALALAAPVARAQDADTPAMRAYEVEAAFGDVAFDLRLAIEGRGYKVDGVSHVGEMLNRTAGAVGAAVTVYDKAEVTQFCSATLSRAVMEADPLNIAFCPYGIFAFQRAGREMVTIGYRRMPEGAMQQVDALLHEIVREAAGLD